jgi:tRNA nucleotidyltransferase/poly(A) polymerase
MTGPRRSAGCATRWHELLAEARIGEIAKASAGVPVHLVGGAVRDAAIGRPVNDLDLVVAENGPAIAARLAGSTGARLVELGGERFGALRLVSGSRHIDIWDLRGGSLVTDLWRRDFSINAIALSVPDGTITDPTGGEADLAARLLRATRSGIFAEDPVRVLRLARLATTLPGFAADPATVTWARRAVLQLPTMPRERLRVELEILLSQARLAPAARWIDDLDLAPVLFGKEAVDPAVTMRAFSAAEKLDLWREARATQRLSPEAKESASRELPLPLHWALLAALCSPPASAAASRVRAAAKRGLLTRARCDEALRLLVPAWRPPADDVAGRRWLHAAGPAWRDALALRATLARTEVEVAQWRRVETALLAWPESLRRGIIAPPALISGQQVQELLGIGPGPAVGAALARVRQAQIDGRVKSREEAAGLLSGEV